jgi:hypothetical protein
LATFRALVFFNLRGNGIVAAAAPVSVSFDPSPKK